VQIMPPSFRSVSPGIFRQSLLYPAGTQQRCQMVSRGFPGRLSRGVIEHGLFNTEEPLLCSARSVTTTIPQLPNSARIMSDLYHWFTEGFDTADLKEAKVLLEELAELA
jgi:hypothetical protein